MLDSFLSSLPSLRDGRLAVRVTSDCLRQVRGGHPWVWGDAITSVSDESAPAGTLAVIFDQKRTFAAIGLWDPESPIRVRVLHAGKPTTIDDAFWMERVAAAVAIREPLRTTGTTGYRVIHGENDGFGGLIADRYHDTLVVKIYSDVWWPHLRSVLDALRTHEHPSRIVLRLGRLAARSRWSGELGLVDGMVIDGTAPDGPILFTENDLTFEADVIDGQKTGHFLDQRDNRLHVRNHSDGADVLDVFSCTGGFSVNAALGGARSVHSVDISPHAIATVERNFAHNPAVTEGTRTSATVGDAFEVMADLAADGRRFDLVVIDPPSFASKASERDGAMRAYRKLTELGLPLLRPGARLVQASCSSRISEDDLVYTVDAAVRSQGRRLLEPETMGHAVDHPISFPQGVYLKAISAVID